MKKIALIAFIAFGCLVNTSFAQKFGYLNLGNMVVQMPETAQADKDLKVYQDGLIAEGTALAEAFAKELAAYEEAAYVKKELSPIDMQKREAELTKKRDDILKKEQEVVQLIANKRQDLMRPILEKLGKAIKEVGKEGGYTFIFDASIQNTILFAKDGDDVEALVKAKLGF